MNFVNILTLDTLKNYVYDQLMWKIALCFQVLNDYLSTIIEYGVENNHIIGI